MTIFYFHSAWFDNDYYSELNKDWHSADSKLSEWLEERFKNLELQAKYREE
jgi:hypothetical protein